MLLDDGCALVLENFQIKVKVLLCISMSGSPVSPPEGVLTDFSQANQGSEGEAWLKPYLANQGPLYDVRANEEHKVVLMMVIVNLQPCRFVRLSLLQQPERSSLQGYLY